MGIAVTLTGSSASRLFCADDGMMCEELGEGCSDFL